MNNTFQGQFPENHVPYEDRSEEEKLGHWIKYFRMYARHGGQDDFPKDINTFKKDIVEKNFNRFLPGIIDAMLVLCFSDIEDIFILEKVPFTDGIQIYDLGGKNFIIEYQKRGIGQYNKTLFQKYLSEDVWKEQQPTTVFDGFFEDNGKYYIVVHGNETSTDEVLLEKGIYKGVVVYPEKYFHIKDKIEKMKQKFQTYCGNILGNIDGKK